jgi:uncharacterized protein
MADFAQTITTAYATDGAALDLGRGVHDGAVVTAATVKASPLWAKYGTRVDNQSAREILAARMAPPAEATEPAQPVRPRQAAAPHRPPAPQHKEAAGAMAGGVAAVTSFLNSREGKQLQKQVVRGVFGLLKKKL